jgi:hypothetical protein
MGGDQKFSLGWVKSEEPSRVPHGNIKKVIRYRSL